MTKAEEMRKITNECIKTNKPELYSMYLNTLKTIEGYAKMGKCYVPLAKVIGSTDWGAKMTIKYMLLADGFQIKGYDEITNAFDATECVIW